LKCTLGCARQDNRIMQTELVRALPVVIILMPFLLSAKERQATIEDTGSTNRLGLRVIFDVTHAPLRVCV